LSFCPEDRLLLACTGAPFRPDGAEHVREHVHVELHWDYVLETSIRHVVSPLVHAGLATALEPDELAALVPTHVRNELRNLHDMTRARSRRLYGALAEIGRQFGRVGVEALALKEIPLALEAFPDLALRPMGDVDLLIRPGDYDRAAAALGTLGYEPLPQAEIPFTLKYACAHHFRRAADEVWVDLQWNLAEREFDVYGEGNFTFDPETMWEGATALALGPDAVFAAPRPEPMLLHLCLHAEGHGYGELVLFADIAALLHRETIDWAAVAELARRYDAQASLYYVLLHAQRLLGAAVPEDALRELEPVYVDGPMANAIFGNLTQLHLALDDVRVLARPPTSTAAAMEEVAREQAVGAMKLSGELDRVLRRFKDRGGSVVIATGAPSERIYPDARLAPFGPLTIVVLGEDLARLRESLIDEGYEDAEAGDQTQSHKRVPIESRDPVLRHRLVDLELEWTFAGDWERSDVLEGTTSRSKKDTALALVRSPWQTGGDRAPLRATVRVLALEPADALALLAARLGAREEDRLFSLWTVAELLRTAPSDLADLDPEEFRTAVARSALVTEICDGLAIAEELVAGGLTAAKGALGCSPRAPRVLKWARYGPGSLIRRTGFKRAFFALYSFKSIASRREQASYLRRAVAGGEGHRPFAHSLLIELAQGGAAAFRASPAGSRELAVWIEPRNLRDLAPDDHAQQHEERQYAEARRSDLVSGDGEQGDDAAQHDEDQHDLH
jgi:putative nucleotidyltransferase-like protein